MNHNDDEAINSYLTSFLRMWTLLLYIRLILSNRIHSNILEILIIIIFHTSSYGVDINLPNILGFIDIKQMTAHKKTGKLCICHV